MQNRTVPFPIPPRAPAGTTIIAFGDVHGHLSLMEEILAKAQARARAKPDRRHIVISLGDLVDRGPDSRGVVARLMGDLPGCELHVLRGNHETLLMSFLAGDPDADVWLKWGGMATVGSYGVDIKGADPHSKRDVERIRAEFRARMLPDHFDFMRTRPLSLTFGDYFFVHAGVRPDVPLAKQKEYDLIWIRDEFLPSGQLFEKKIVHGHTSVEEPDFRTNRINLDTGACYGGKLTAAIFEDDVAEVFASIPAPPGTHFP
ncbi:metallophosphoesterase family protein [Labrys neptuniae]|uniref:metallophosphoesterase family protein n=1 Tax=Labrys neptuniae TaxID=376174 RepID=UPI00288CD9CF|nr:metallophosphoesterase family protein [Labrys neptuniae]MDT3377006.1 metallophosphoesterase family protein [Labrys neptuniae]